MMISIHTLRVEGDAATCIKHDAMAISIHTLRVEGDKIINKKVVPATYFNPHPPGGG